MENWEGSELWKSVPDDEVQFLRLLFAMLLVMATHTSALMACIVLLRVVFFHQRHRAWRCKLFQLEGIGNDSPCADCCSQGRRI